MYNEEDIKFFIDDIKKGNDNAFNDIYNNYNSFVRSIIYSYTQDQETINDYAQDVWALIYRKIHLYKNNSFLAWIKRLTNNKCIDIYRRKKAKDIPTNEINDYTIYEDIPEDNGITPKEFEQTITDILDNLTTLTERQHKVLILRLLDTPFKDISDRFNIPYGSCTTAYHDAVIKIRRELINLGYDVSKPTNLCRMRKGPRKKYPKKSKKNLQPID